MLRKDKVFIIIVAYNGRQYWPDLMPLLSQEKYEDFDLQILVVDNASSDNSVEYLEQHYPEIKIIKNNSNTGFAKANNIGYDWAKKYKADYIYLLKDRKSVV